MSYVQGDASLISFRRKIGSDRIYLIGGRDFDAKAISGYVLFVSVPEAANPVDFGALRVAGWLWWLTPTLLTKRIEHHIGRLHPGESALINTGRLCCVYAYAPHGHSSVGCTIAQVY